MPESPFDGGNGGQNAQGSEPVPEDVYGSWCASPSPDGKYVALISDRSGEPAVWVEGPAARQLTKLPILLPRVLTVSWSPDGAWLACVTAAFGSSRNEVWVVRPDGRELRLVAGGAPSTAVLGGGAWHGWSADGRLLVTETTASGSAALLIDPVDGAREVLATGPLLALLDYSPVAGVALLRHGPRSARRLAVHPQSPRASVHDHAGVGAGDRASVHDHAGVGAGDRASVHDHAGVEFGIGVGTAAGELTGSVECGYLSPDGRTVFACSDVGRELAALVRVSLDDGAVTVLAERDDAELQDVMLSGDGSTLVLLWNMNGGLSAVSLFDVGTGRERPVRELPRDVVDECRLTPDGASLLLTAEDWADPRGVWRIDLVSGDAVPLSSRGDGELRGSRGATASSVGAADLTRPQLRRFSATDGLELTGWLYRPDAPGPWPTMIHLHGGPEAQERPVYNSLFQSLVSAGIAVFAPNVRGSSGFGRAFLEADHREKRPAAITDVADAVRHLVETGVAPADRVGCMGRSYGGYLTLAALVWHPELFAVGVDVCGMSDLETFYQHTEPWIAAAAISKYGDPVDDAQLLRAVSPIHRIDRLRAPLLVVHGDEDTNVPLEEAQQVVSALAARGVAHRFLLFAGEGHELLGTQNRVTFVQTTVAWTAQHLGVPLTPSL